MSEDFKARLARARVFARSLSRLEQETASSIASREASRMAGATRPDSSPSSLAPGDWPWAFHQIACNQTLDWSGKYEFCWVREVERVQEIKARDEGERPRFSEPRELAPAETWSEGRE